MNIKYFYNPYCQAKSHGDIKIHLDKKHLVQMNRNPHYDIAHIFAYWKIFPKMKRNFVSVDHLTPIAFLSLVTSLLSRKFCFQVLYFHSNETESFHLKLFKYSLLWLTFQMKSLCYILWLKLIKRIHFKCIFASIKALSGSIQH